MMFPLTDCLDGIGSPGSGCPDFSDPMLLPILDIPVLEGLEPESIPVKEVKPAGCVSIPQELTESAKTPDMASNNQIAALNTLPKEEAVLLLAPGYEPVSFPSRKERSFQSIFKSPYVPGAKKALPDITRSSEYYVYGATPPCSPARQVHDRKRDHYEMIFDKTVYAGKRLKKSGSYSNPFNNKLNITLQGTLERVSMERMTLTGKTVTGKQTSLIDLSANQLLPRRFSSMMLATEVNCILLQLVSLQVRDAHIVKHPSILPSGNMKELPLCSLSNASNYTVKMNVGIQQEKKRKDCIPSRITGDIEEEVIEEPRVSQIGVWHPVGAPKSQRGSNSISWNENTQSNSVATTLDAGAVTVLENSASFAKNNHWKELLDTLPLLIQQGSVLYDITLDGECGEGPLGWLSCQEQERLKSVCGPGSIHAGCGGMLSVSHFLDNAGVELLDPLTSEISAGSVATILQSDMRIAMATAFGDSVLDGPLSLGEWLKGRAFISDTCGADSGLSDSKEMAGTGLPGIVEPITPPQCTTGPAGLKISVHDIDSQPCDTHRNNNTWVMEGSSLSDDGCTRRYSQETGSIETDALVGSGRAGPTIMALPMPSLLVGYQDDWLKISSSTLHLWEKAPFEPYATAKPVIYHVICPRIESLLLASGEYMQQLSCVYDACMLGTHVAANTISGQSNLLPAAGKTSLTGFWTVDYPPQSSQQGQSDSPSALNNFVTGFGKDWNPQEFLKSLSKLCKTLPVSGINAPQREHETAPSLAYYIVCPSSDPNVVLQTMLVACQSLGHNIAIYDKQRKANISSRTSLGSAYIEDSTGNCDQGIIGFTTSRIVLQILTAETVLKPTSPISLDMDSLKEVAFSVYNKIRRISCPYRNSDFSVHNTQSNRSRNLTLQSSPAVSGMWKDFSMGRSTVTSTSLSGHDSLLESGPFRSNNWDAAWQQQGVSNEITTSNHVQQLHDNCKYLFEPLYILAEPGNLDHGVGVSASRFTGLDDASGSTLTGSSEATHGTIADSGADYDVTSGGSQKPMNFHCCYDWTEDWQWLVSVWTDARGELLDVHLFPAGINGHWDSKTLHGLFVQVLMHGCQLLTMANGTGSKTRALVVTRIGTFYEVECQEWQKAIITVGSGEVRKWPVQIWHQHLENNAVAGSSISLHAQDVSSLAERAILGGPSSPGSSSMFLSRNKPSNFGKTEMGGVPARKQAGGGLCHGQGDVSRGGFHCVQSISFVTVILDHTLQIVGLQDVGLQSATGIGSQNSVSSGWLNSSSASVLTALGSGVGVVRTLATSAASYIFVPAHGLRFISDSPLRSSTCNPSELPIPEQVVRKSGPAVTVASAFVVSKAVPSIRTELNKSTEEWPATLFVGLVGHMSSCVGLNPQSIGQNIPLGNDSIMKAKHTKPSSSDVGSAEMSEAHMVIESIAAELQALSWLSASPTFPFRRSALPFHCDILQRLRRLLQYAVNEMNELCNL
ncbi:hypothetical protein KP509_39G047500 [Ceratopteris richardii]|nr:hypothetical protein KP509_39G047500 [Ceratopteris richardii]